MTPPLATDTPPQLVAFQVRDGRGWRTIVKHFAATADKVRTVQTRRGRVEGKHYRFAKVTP